MLTCVSCSNPVSAEAKFCTYCSAPINLPHTSKVDSAAAAASTHPAIRLMPAESVLLESEGKSLILTTHRLRYQAETFGSTVIKSIMLEELASCALVRSSKVIFLVLAGACLVLGFLVAAAERRNEGALVVGIALALIFAVVYLASRRQVMAFASAGTTISVDTRGMKLETARQFIEQTEAAKNTRYVLGK